MDGRGSPFAARSAAVRANGTAAERAAKGDPRPSIAERYGSRDRYLTLVREAATRLVTARHALAEDVDAMVSRAGVLWDFVYSAE